MLSWESVIHISLIGYDQIWKYEMKYKCTDLIAIWAY